jgi:hypothetical protein
MKTEEAPVSIQTPILSWPILTEKVSKFDALSLTDIICK